MSGEFLKGRLLVANPAMQDPNFHRTIVFVIDHGASGALGVVLNRPTAVTVGDALTHWADLAADPPVIFCGGPVDPAAAICLARAIPGRGGPEHDDFDRNDLDRATTSGAGDHVRWSPVLGSVGTFDLTEAGPSPNVVIERLRIFAGYAGWGGGQLEDELSAGGWFVVPADAEDLLSPSPGLLWRGVLQRQPGALSVLSSYPADPSLN